MLDTLLAKIFIPLIPHLLTKQIRLIKHNEHSFKLTSINHLVQINLNIWTIEKNRIPRINNLHSQIRSLQRSP